MLKGKAVVLLGTLAVSGAVLADLNSGLIAHWSFDDCKATDSSGNRHHGAIKGKPKCIIGVKGKALQFNGVSDFVEVVDATDLRLSGTSYTLSGWAYIIDYNSSWQSALVGKRGTSSQDGYLWSLTGKEAGIPLGRPNINISGGDDPWIASRKGSPLKKWRHIVVVYDINTQIAKLYVNNAIEASSANFPTPNPNTATNLSIARDSDGNQSGGYFLNGNLDDIRIYNRALAASEIAELYNMGQPITGITKGLQQINVTCKNTTTGQTVVIPGQTGTTWDCKKAGLKTQPNQTVNISIDGATYP